MLSQRQLYSTNNLLPKNDFRYANEQHREIGAFRSAVNGFENLVAICERMDDIEAAVKWCKQARDWAESVDRIDLSDAAKKFERR